MFKYEIPASYSEIAADLYRFCRQQEHEDLEGFTRFKALVIQAKHNTTIRTKEVINAATRKGSYLLNCSYGSSLLTIVIFETINKIINSIYVKLLKVFIVFFQVLFMVFFF
jgi:hypothetical protein